MTSPNRPTAAKVIVALVKLALFVAVIVVVGQALAERLMDMPWSSFHVNYPPLLLAVAVLLVTMATISSLYFIVLRTLQKTPGLLVVMAIMWLARIGKYMPGKIASTAGAAYMLQKRQVPIGASMSALLTVQGMLVLVGLVAAAPLTLSHAVTQRLPLAWVWCGAFIAAACVGLHPAVFCRVANFILAKCRVHSTVIRLQLKQYILPLGILVIEQILGGVSLWLLANSLTSLSIVSLPLCISATAFAGAIGLLALFAPGGLGVREFILLVIMGQVMTAENAAILALLVRLIQTVLEILLAIVGATILAVVKPPPQAAPTTALDQHVAAGR